MRSGIATLPLHRGTTPKWLFKRMIALGREIGKVVFEEYGRDEFLSRISNPFWFQAFACVLGFDWHSSGTTTVTCGALKEAFDIKQHGIAVCGGKGKTARRALEEIEKIGIEANMNNEKIEKIKYASKMTAKVDSAAIQDGYELYHHVLLLTDDGNWAVVQQGMDKENNYARRYHWLSKNVNSFVLEPHEGIAGIKRIEKTLDMTAKQSLEAQKISVDIVRDKPKKLMGFVIETKKKQRSLLEYTGEKYLFMPNRINWKLLKEIYEYQPKNYEELIGFKGCGATTIRALALVSELIYGSPPSWEDPVKFSFAHGGKDGLPYPVNKKLMDETIEILRNGIEEAKIGNREKINAIARLNNFIPRKSI
ncbi:MAG: DUF763 domain-containing protein [Candidatus Thermoplasmatota archaeon]